MECSIFKWVIVRNLLKIIAINQYDLLQYSQVFNINNKYVVFCRIQSINMSIIQFYY